MRITQIIEAMDSAVGDAEEDAENAQRGHHAEMQAAHALRNVLILGEGSLGQQSACRLLRQALTTRPLSAARALVAMAEAITSAVELHAEQTAPIVE